MSLMCDHMNHKYKIPHHAYVVHITSNLQPGYVLLDTGQKVNEVSTELERLSVHIAMHGHWSKGVGWHMGGGCREDQHFWKGA